MPSGEKPSKVKAKARAFISLADMVEGGGDWEAHKKPSSLRRSDCLAS